MSTQHTIDKQVFQIRTGQGVDDISLNKELTLLKREVNVELESIFDHYFPSDRLIEIQHLKVDLGTFSSQDFQQEFKERLRSLLTSKLEDLIGKDEFKKHIQKGQIIISDQYEAFQYYLINGYQPTYFDVAISEISQQFEILLTRDETRLRTIFQSIKGNNRARQRWAQQLTEGQLRLVNQWESGKSSLNVSKPIIDRDNQLDRIRDYYLNGGELEKLLWIKNRLKGLLNSDNNEIIAFFRKHLGVGLVTRRVVGSLSFEELNQLIEKAVHTHVEKRNFAEITYFNNILLNILPGNSWRGTNKFKKLQVDYTFGGEKSSDQRVNLLITYLKNEFGEVEVFNAKLLSIISIEQALESNIDRSFDKKLTEKFEENIPENIASIGESSSLQERFLYFLSFGVLHGSRSLWQIIEQLIIRHEVILKKALHENWHKYTIRYRLAYQVQADQLLTLSHLIFPNSNYKIWFVEVVELLDTEVDLPNAWKNHLYFSFFMIHSPYKAESMGKIPFVNDLLSHWRDLLTDSEYSATKSSKEVEPIDKLIVKLLQKQKLIENKGQNNSPWDELQVLTEQGILSTTYKKRYNRSVEVQQLFSKVLSDRELFREKFPEHNFESTFWTVIMLQLKPSQLEEILSVLRPDQFHKIVAISQEFKTMEQEVLLTSGVIYPVSPELMVFMIKLSSKQRFGRSDKDLSVVMFMAAFFPQTMKEEHVKIDQKREIKDSAYRIGLQYLLSTPARDIEWKYPLLLNLVKSWVKEDTLDQENHAGDDKNWIHNEMGKVAYENGYNLLDLIESYLLSGRLPDWSAITNEKELSALVNEVFLTSPAQLVDRISFLISNEEALNRFLMLISEVSVFRLLTHGGNTDGREYKEIYEDFLKLSDFEVFKKTSDNQLDIFILKQIVKHSLNDQSSSLGLNSLITHLVEQLSDRFKVNQSVIHKILFLLRRQLINQELRQAIVISNVELTEKIDDRPKVEDYLIPTKWIIRYLDQGHVPEDSEVHDISVFTLTLNQGITRSDRDMINSLKRGANTEDYVSRLVDLLPLPTLHRFLEKVDPKRYVDFELVTFDFLTLFNVSSLINARINDFKMFLAYELSRFLLLPVLKSTDNEHFGRALFNKTIIRYRLDVGLTIKVISSVKDQLRSNVLIGLIRELQSTISADPIQNALLIKKKYQNQYEITDLIRYYLITGHLPMWSKAIKHNKFKVLVLEGFNNRSLTIFSLMNDLARDDEAINRLAGLIGAPKLHEQVYHIDAGKGQLVEELLIDLTSFQRKTSFWAVSLKEFEVLIYHISVKAVIALVTGEITFYTFINRLIQRLSKEFSWPFLTVIDALRLEEHSFKSQALKAFLLKADEQIVLEQYTSPSWQKAEVWHVSTDRKGPENWKLVGVKEEFHQQYDSLSLIRYYIVKGNLPNWSDLKSVQELASLIDQFMPYLRSQLTNLILDIELRENALKRLTKIVNHESLWTLLTNIDAISSKFLIDFSADLVAYRSKTNRIQDSVEKFKEFLLLESIKSIVKLQTSFEQINTVLDDLITRLSNKFSVNQTLLLNDIGRIGMTPRSLWLSLKVSKQKGKSNSLLEVDNIKSSNLEGEISLLLHLLEYNDFPWWFTKEERSLKSHTQQIAKRLLKDQFETLLNAIVKLPKAAFYIKSIVDIYDGQDIFYRILNFINSNTAGFVITYLMAIEEVSRNRSIVFTERDYGFILNEVNNSRAVFSALDFVRKATTLFARKENRDLAQYLEKITNRVKDRIQKGERRYVPLRDILKQINIDTIDPLTVRSHEMISTEPEVLNDESFEDQVTSYLINGSLTPWSTIKYKSNQEFLDHYDRYLKNNGTSLRTLLIRILKPDSLLNTLLQRHDDDLIVRLVTTLIPNRSEELIVWTNNAMTLLKVLYPQVPDKSFKILLWKSLLRHLVDLGGNQLDLKTYWRLLLQTFSKTLLPGLYDELPHKIHGVKVVEPMVAQEVAVINALISDHHKSERRNSKPKQKASDNTINEDVEPVALDGTVLVKNAGMVILAAFLSRYFEMLEMLDDNKFKSSRHAARAVHLLQYLATNTTTSVEHELLLNKVLCGMAINEPLELSIALTEKEIETSASLLLGVRQNWDKMKESGEEALRESFLIREGNLQETEGSFKLKVSKKTIDILLDYLPWSFNLIKLPWMKKPLEVEWL